MTTLKEQDTLAEEQKTKLQTVPEDIKRLVTIANKLKTIENIPSLEEDDIEFISKCSSEEDLRNIFESLLRSTKDFFKEYMAMKANIAGYKKECDINCHDINKKDKEIAELKNQLKQSDKLNIYLSCAIGMMFVSLVIITILM